MKFWDSSAIIPLILTEPFRRQLLDLLGDDSMMIVWWGTSVECTSAVARREREGDLTVHQATDVLDRLRMLSASWHEVTPSEPVRRAAQRLLRVHPVRAADALQLAAAIIASEHEPGSLGIVSLDERLTIAAQREGFDVVAV